ncbi:MAG TPA: HAD family phosphatase [Solirubrobacterales bacterium]|nr:HAD family phosphatase [Solirubrobacterales bacterium]
MKAVISDFGGVLTTPLAGAFEALHEETGVSLESLGGAMHAITERDGAHPLFELECGRITEAEFAGRVAAELTEADGSRPDLSSFGEIFFRSLAPNQAMIELMREIGGTGRRMALLTNNVREWQPRWRAMAPIDEIFELVVDSAFVDCRKPEPEIYRITLDRLDLDPADCLFIDDVGINCKGATEAGMHAVHFQDNAQAEAEIRAALAT